jgi:hypothetical protein
VGQHAVSEFACHDIQAAGPIVKGRDQREDRGSGVGSPVHVADVDFVERRLAHAEHQGTLLFEADIGRALDEVRGNAIGNAGQRPDTARDDHHGIAGIRPAGYVGADIGVGLLVNFAGGFADELADEIASPAQFEFFGHNSKSAIGGDEVYGSDALVAFHREQQMFQEYRAAGASGSDGQVLRWVVGQAGFLVLASPEHRETVRGKSRTSRPSFAVRPSRILPVL